MRFEFKVTLEVPDDDMRFIDGPDSLLHGLQDVLDNFSSDAADEQFDDEGRLALNFTVEQTL